jgi:ferredoxin-nitrate reductase
LDCDKGILINRYLQTSDPHVFAIGECAELDGHTFGTTAAAQEQARGLAEFLRGNEHAPYTATTSANILKLHDFQLASAGMTDPESLAEADPEIETITLSDSRKRYYQKLVIKRDRLIGAICMGDAAEFPCYLEWISSGRELDEDRDTLLRPTGGGAGTRSLLDGALVCSCHQVGRNTIAAAAREEQDRCEGLDATGCAGECDRNDGVVERVCKRTKAGTGCGVCRPEIVQIVKSVRPVVQNA